MAKPKEGRQRTSRLDFTSEGGRLLLFDLMKPSESSFSPFLESDYQSERFWKSRPEYQTVSFPSFLQHASVLAKMARNEMTTEKKEEELARIGRLTVERNPDKNREIATPNKENKPNEDHIHDPLSSSKPQQPEKNQFKSLRDTIVAPHANREMAIIIFEFDGDIDENSIQLQFAKKGSKIKLYSRIPTELTSASSLLGYGESRNSFQDADCMLLDQVIKERLKGSRKDSNGDYWEIREVIDLPFRCKKAIYNKNRDEIPTYLLRPNAHGYAWGYFWVLGEHVGQKVKTPTKIRCQATSDSESESDGNMSKLYASDSESDKEEDLNEDLDHMEVDSEAPSHDTVIEKKKHEHVNKKKPNLDELRNEHLERKKSIEKDTRDVLPNATDTSSLMKSKITELQQHMDTKNDEFLQLKQDTECKMMSLEKQHKREKKLIQDTYEKEKGELLDKMNDLQCAFEIFKRRETQASEMCIGEYQQKIHQLESQTERMNVETCEALEKREKIIQQLHENGIKTERELEASQKRVLLLESQIDRMNINIKETLARKAKEEEEWEQKERKMDEDYQKKILLLESQIDAMNNKIIATIEEKEKEKEELEQKGRKKEKEYQKSLMLSKKKLETLETKTTIERNQHKTMLESSNAKFCIFEKDAKAELHEQMMKLEAGQKKLKEAELLLLEKDQQSVYQNDQIERLQSLLVDLEKNADQCRRGEKNYVDQINGLKKHLMHQRKYVQALERKVERFEKCKKNVRLTSELATDEEMKTEFSDLNRWDSYGSFSNGSQHIVRESRETEEHEDFTTNEETMVCNLEKHNMQKNENDFMTHDNSLRKDQNHTKNQESRDCSNEEKILEDSRLGEDRIEQQGFLHLEKDKEKGCSNFSQMRERSSSKESFSLQEPLPNDSCTTEEFRGPTCDSCNEVLVETILTEEGEAEETTKEECDTDSSLLVGTIFTGGDRKETDGLKCGSDKRLLVETIITDGDTEENDGNDKTLSVETIIAEGKDSINQTELPNKGTVMKQPVGRADDSKQLNTLTDNRSEQQAETLATEHGREIVEECTKKVSKKRKLAVDHQEENPNKKIRKSRRIEEKRLARLMKPKID